MTTLYYQQDTLTHLKGDYALRIDDADADLFLESHPGLYFYYEDTQGNTDNLAYMGIDISVGGSE